MKRYSLFLLFLILVGVSFRIGQRSAEAIDPMSGLDYTVSNEVWSVVKDKYLRANDVDQSDLKYGLAKGLVNSLGDMHSNYMDPSESEAFISSLNGELEGIGAELRLVDGSVQIISPLPDSPAQLSGIRPGDFILKVDGEMLGNVTDLTDVVLKIRGPEGTTVVLNILHDGDITPVDISIKRASIHVDAVSWEEKRFGASSFAYVKFSSFTETSADEFEQVLKEINEKGYNGMVLDFRFNGGGFLDSAVSVVSHLINPDKAVVRIVYQDSDEMKKSLPEDIRFDGKIVLLINDSSASASEIVAGALQDYDRAQIIGVKSFGKGSVQEVHPFSDNSLLRITVAEWLTPLERSIEGKGIEPDQIVELDYEAFLNGDDNQLNVALEYLTL